MQSNYFKYIIFVNDKLWNSKYIRMFIIQKYLEGSASRKRKRENILDSFIIYIGNTYICVGAPYIWWGKNGFSIALGETKGLQI